MNPPNGILVAQALQHLHWAQLQIRRFKTEGRELAEVWSQRYGDDSNAVEVAALISSLENDALVDASVSIATAVSVLEKMEGL